MAQLPMTPSGIMNLKTAAHYVGVYVGTLRNIMRRTKSKPPYYRLGGRYFFRKEDLDNWLEGFKNK